MANVLRGYSLVLVILICLIHCSVSGQEAQPVDAAPLFRLNQEHYDQLDNEYYVKPGDVFFISIIGNEPKEIIGSVNVTGKIVLHPIAPPIPIAGISLKQAREVIENELKKYFYEVEISVVLKDISPQRLHIFGAVNKPGEYIVDSLSTLYQGLERAGGLTPAASRRIRVIRRGETRNYDLNRYIFEGVTRENPLLYNDDVIFVNFADSYAKVYVVTDSVNYVEYFEIDAGKSMPLNNILLSISNKNRHSNYKSLNVIRDGEIKQVDKDFPVKPGDRVYLKSEQSYIFIRGNVNTPGRFTYVPEKHPHYYISNAGGINRVGSSNRILIVKQDGKRVRYRGQTLEEGDTLIVPLSSRAFVTDYLTPISTILSLVTTIIILTR